MSNLMSRRGIYLLVIEKPWSRRKRPQGPNLILSVLLLSVFFFFPVSLPTSKLFGEACDAVRDAGVGMLQNKMLLRTIT